MAKIYLRSSGSRSHVETHRSLDKTAYPAVAISDRKTRAILFLRAASGRASIGLAAFYMYLAATEADLDAPTPIHADEVRRATLRYSALWTVALCVRSIFDDEADSATRLNAKSVVNLSDVGREQVAQYWAEKKAARALADARLAIRFVVRLLERGAVSIRGACKSHYTLIRRIALVKALADREAAHISVQHYELTTSDLAH